MLIGFTAIAAQIVLMREFMIVFYGNEISTAIILSAWLIWGAIGSWFLGRFTAYVKLKAELFSACQLCLSFLAPLTILATRYIKIAFGLAPGELIGFTPMFVSSFVILAPLCTLLGFMFALACRLEDLGHEPARNISLVYGWESVGALLGGVCASFVLIRLLNPLEIAVTLGLLNIGAAVYLQAMLQKRGTGTPRLGLYLTVFILFLGIWLCKGWDVLDAYVRQQQWRGYQILTSQNSVYGNIMVTQRAGTYSLFDNGLLLYTVPDRQSAEETIHFPLLEHRSPQEILLIGGGSGGLIEEILKQPVKKIDYLELDPLVIKLSAQYLPSAVYAPLKSDRVTILNLDGRFFIKGAQHKYDCVIMHLGDAYTAQANRYYTLEFFQEVKNILQKGGIFSFALGASESYISPDLAEYLQSIYAALKKVFKYTAVIPGDTAYFLACDQAGVLTYDYRLLMNRAKDRGLDLKYVREYYLFSKFSPQLISYTLGVLSPWPGTKINHDFQPAAYYYNMIFSSARSGEAYLERLFKTVTREKLRGIVLGFCLLLVAWGLYGRFQDKQNLYQKICLLALTVTGFSAMAAQIIVLLAFQAIYGYVFYKIGVLLTAFMFGLTLGNFWIMRWLGNKNHSGIFIYLQFALCIFFLCLPEFFAGVSSLYRTSFTWWGANIVFPLLSAMAGCITGGQFPLANKIHLGSNQAARGAGVVYGLDLLGACSGALLTGVFLIPVLGINGSCWMIALLNFSVFAALLFNRKRYLL